MDLGARVYVNTHYGYHVLKLYSRIRSFLLHLVLLRLGAEGRDLDGEESALSLSASCRRYAKLVERYRGDLNDTRLLRATLEPRRMLRVHSSIPPDPSARLGGAWLDLEHRKWEADASFSDLDSSGRKAAATAVQDSV